MKNLLSSYFNFLDRFVTRKRGSLIEQATRTQPLDQPLFKAGAGITFVYLGFIFLSAGLIMFGIGGWIFETLQPSWASGKGVVFFGLEGYWMFLLAWIFPSLLLGAAIPQATMVLFPKLGNSLTADDTINSLALTNKDLKARLKQGPLSIDEMQEALKFVDLRFLARFALKRLVLMAAILIVILSPIMYLAGNSYLAITPDGQIAHSSYWSLEQQLIDPADIVDVEVGIESSSSGYDGEEHVDPYYELTFPNGTVVDVWGIGLNGTDPEALIALSALLIEHDVDIFAWNYGDISNLRQSIQDEINYVFDEIDRMELDALLNGFDF